MRKILIVATLVGLAYPALADPAYTITNMRCSEVQAAVQQQGSVLLRWRSKSGMPLYGRYASDRRFCRPGEIINFSSVPAGDKMCTVKKCVYKIPSRR